MGKKYVMRDPVPSEHRRRRGNLMVRYTCGTCGKRSRWKSPLKGMRWLFDHNPERCVIVTEQTPEDDWKC